MPPLDMARDDRAALDGLRARLPLPKRYYLAETGSRAPARRQFYSHRKATLSGCIGKHSAENATRLALPDLSAEGVANYIRTRTTAGSYHTVTDLDSVVRVGSYDWQMFHEGTGGNRHSIGLSVAIQADMWPGLIANRPDLVRLCIRQQALASADATLHIRDRVGIDVPRRRITAAEYRGRVPGYCPHGDIDPGRRYDPGADYPWDLEFEMIDYLLEETPMSMNDWPGPDELRSDVAMLYQIHGVNPSEPVHATAIDQWTRNLVDKGTGQPVLDHVGREVLVTQAERDSPKATYAFVDNVLGAQMRARS